MEHFKRTIYTIGHSTHPIGHFNDLLRMNEISLLVDVRHYPGSRRYPHFNSELLAASLLETGVRYRHLVDLGGRRKPVAGSKNSRWRNEAFRGYADHMSTLEFQNSLLELEREALNARTAYMCSEAVWWSCHRALISDFLKVRGWTVMHILGNGKVQEHPYTSAARIEDGELRYDGII